jgi:hypothetical protein
MTRRYGTSTSKELASGVLVGGGLGLGFIALIVYMYLDTRGAPPELLLLATPGVLLVGGALYYWNKHRSSVLVDFTKRQVTFSAAGKPSWSAPLDELAPLAIVAFQRELLRSSGKYWRTEYRVVIGGASNVPIYADWTYQKARRAADALARAWKVGLCPLDGRIRQVGELDESVAAAQLKSFNPQREARAPFGAESGVSLDEQPDRAVLRSSSDRAEAPSVLWLMAAGMTGLAASERDVQMVMQEPLANPLETALVSALLLALLITLGLFLYETWRAILPAEVRINSTRVEYRGRRVPTGDVVEVVSAGAILVCTPRKTLEIPAGFCAPRATEQVIAELRRLIAERGRPR